MSASAIIVNGRLTRRPGSYTEVDASGLNAPAAGAIGVVAVLGAAVGGRPVSTITDAVDLPSFVRTERMVSAFRSGPLREVADMLFSPGRDPDVPSGAAQVIACKVNPATQSTAVLQRSGSTNITLSSRDYGAFTEQINVSIAAGSTAGKAVTVQMEDTVETGDNIGGTDLATLQYAGGALGYQTAALTINEDGDFTVAATRSGLGQSNLITTPHAGTTIEIVSSSVADTAITATVYGLQAGVPAKTTVTLTGTTPVALGTWNTGSVFGVVLSAAAAGIVTLRNTAGAVVILDLPAATISEGVLRCEHCYVDRTGFSIAADGATTVGFAVFGRNASGALRAETGLLNNATPVASTITDYAMIDVIVVAAVPNTRTVTLTPTRAARTLATSQNTLQKVKDYFDAKVVDIGAGVLRGFIFAFTSGSTQFLTSDLDLQTSVSILTAAGIRADQYVLAAWFNTNSTLVSASIAAGAAGGPDNTSTPVFLSGGSEGVALFSHYQAALNLLKQLRVNTIVDLSGDPAVAAALDAHCAFMCGAGRNERDGVVGVLNAGATDVPSLTEFKAAALALNSRHIRVVGQAAKRFNTDGVEVEFLPPYLAAVIAGMQAGSAIGTSLTHKVANVRGVRQSTTWNPTDNGEDLLASGCLFLENKPNVGIRVVRNITTHLSTDNIAFTEASVNEAVNIAVYEFRTALESCVARAGFAGSPGSVRALAQATLGRLVEDGVIAAWRGLSVEVAGAGDELDVGVELAPVIPTNFIKSKIRLATLAQLAAGSAR